MAGKLNTAKLRTLTEPGVYRDGDGLYLKVTGADRRAWVYRYTLRGKAHWMGLGALSLVSLAEARDKALAARKVVKAGKDPLAERRAETAAKAAAEAAVILRPFRDVADAYLGAHADGWKNPKHRQQWRNTLDSYVLPKIGDKAVADVAVGDVMDVLEPIWRTVPETASRVRGRIESILDFATARGWRTGDNPARWRGHLENLLPTKAKIAKVEHHAALPWREIGTFMVTLSKQEGASPLALRLLILAATRTNETLGARWSEIDTAAAVWTIPAERMKAHREHRIPLSKAALAVVTQAATLRTDKAPDAFVFPGGKVGKPLSNMALLMTLRRMKRDDLTAHGFRSTFRDWAAEATNYPRDVAEQALAHSLPDKVEAAYRRGDLIEKRAQLMADWATFCAKPLVAGDVIPLRAKDA